MEFWRLLVEPWFAENVFRDIRVPCCTTYTFYKALQFPSPEAALRTNFPSPFHLASHHLLKRLAHAKHIEPATAMAAPIIYDMCLRSLHQLLLWPLGYAEAPRLRDGPMLFYLLFMFPNALFWAPLFEPWFESRMLGRPWKGVGTLKQYAFKAAFTFVLYFVFWLVVSTCRYLATRGPKLRLDQR